MIALLLQGCCLFCVAAERMRDDGGDGIRMESDAEYSESEATTSEGTASDADSEVEIAELMGMPVEASSGKQEYLTRCTELKIVPVAMFIAKLECEHVSVRHHGLGPKGAQAVAAALRTLSLIHI